MYSVVYLDKADTHCRSEAVRGESLHRDDTLPSEKPKKNLKTV